MKRIKLVTSCGRALPRAAVGAPHEGHKSAYPDSQDGMKGIRVVGCVNNEFYPLFPGEKN